MVSEYQLTFKYFSEAGDSYLLWNFVIQNTMLLLANEA